MLWLVGSVSVWNLHTESPLLRSSSADGRTVVLRPFRTLSTYLMPVTSIAFCQRLPFMLASCSLDRFVKVSSTALLHKRFCWRCVCDNFGVRSLNRFAVEKMKFRGRFSVVWDQCSEHCFVLWHCWLGDSHNTQHVKNTRSTYPQSFLFGTWPNLE